MNKEIWVSYHDSESNQMAVQALLYHKHFSFSPSFLSFHTLFRMWSIDCDLSSQAYEYRVTPAARTTTAQCPRLPAFKVEWEAWAPCCCLTWSPGLYLALLHPILTICSQGKIKQYSCYSLRIEEKS